MGTSYTLNYIIIGLALSAGMVLVVVRPYWAFLAVIFVIMGLSVQVIGFTRTEELGSYFNLADACTLIAILACLLDRRRALVFPTPVVAIVAVLAMGLLVSAFNVGLTYGVQRGFRWAINLPLFFFLSANLIQDEKRVKSLLVTLILAAVAAEGQHMLLVVIGSMAGEGAEFLRIGGFGFAGTEVWLLAGVYENEGRVPRRWTQLGIGALIVMGLVSMQTRSLALALAASILVYYLWFLSGLSGHRWLRFKNLLYALAIGLSLMAVAGLAVLVQGYADRFSQTLDKNVLSGKQIIDTRQLVIEQQLKDWLDGNILFGRGLNYFEVKAPGRKSARAFVDWNFMTYVAYLSQLGLIGLFVYGLWLPLAVLRRARRLLKLPDIAPAVFQLAALTGACFIIYPLVFVFSSNFLAVSYLPGILAGSVWGLSSTVFKEKLAGTA